MPDQNVALLSASEDFTDAFAIGVDGLGVGKKFPLANVMVASPIIGVPQAILLAEPGENITTKLNALMAKYPNGSRIVVRPGTYDVDFGKVVPQSSTVIQAVPGTVVLNGVAATASGGYGHAVFSVIPGRKNIFIEGINFTAPTRHHALVIARGCDGLTLRDCHTGNACLLWTQRTSNSGGFDLYSAMNASTWCKNIDVFNCTGEGVGTAGGGLAQWIEMRYVNRWSVSYCRAKGYSSGIQWWGGDSGAAADAGSDWISGERKCSDGFILNCIMTDVPYGCIWGSMGIRINVMGGFVARAADICLDFEGCEECSAEAITSVDGGNACVATYFGAKGVTLRNIRVIISDATLYPHAYRTFCNQQENTAARHLDVVIEGWHVDCKSYGSAGLPPRIGDLSGPPEGIIVRHCKLINTRIVFDANNGRNVTIEDNDLDFRLTPTVAFNAIHTNKNHRDPAQSVYTVTIARNIIRGGTMPAGSRAVYCKQEGDNKLIRHHVNDNEVRGTWTRDYLFENAMTNSGSRFDVTFTGNKLAGNTGVWEVLNPSTAILAAVIYNDNTYEFAGLSADWRFSQTVDLPDIAAGAYSPEQTLSLPLGIHAATSHIWEGTAAAVAEGNKLDIEAWVTSAATPTASGVLTWRARNRSAAAVNLGSAAIKFRQVSRVP